MTFNELVNEVAAHSQVSKTDVSKVLKETFEQIGKLTRLGIQVKIPRFGRFLRKEVKSRKLPNGLVSPANVSIKLKVAANQRSIT